MKDTHIQKKKFLATRSKINWTNLRIIRSKIKLFAVKELLRIWPILTGSLRVGRSFPPVQSNERTSNIHIHMYIVSYVCMYIYMYMYVYICMCICIWCIYTYICMLHRVNCICQPISTCERMLLTAFGTIISLSKWTPRGRLGSQWSNPYGPGDGFSWQHCLGPGEFSMETHNPYSQFSIVFIIHSFNRFLAVLSTVFHCHQRRACGLTLCQLFGVTCYE